MANIKDVAKRAGVSVTTVSRVINDNGPVNPDTRKAVEKAMKELNYVPNQLAQGMRTRRSNTIGVIIPEYINLFYQELFQYIEEEAGKSGYRILVSSIRGEPEEEIDHIKDLLSRRIDGIIICTYKGDKEFISYLLQVGQGVPIVFLDNLDENLEVNAVYTDGYKSVKELVIHLIGLGHEKIGFIKGLSQYHVANDRYAGYLAAMEEKGLIVKPQWVFEGDYHVESGYRAAQYFKDKCLDPPTAVVASSDLMAIGAMNYFLTKGLRIPEDIAVAGYDDIFMSRLMVPPLTTVAQPVKQISREAVNMVICKKPNNLEGHRRVVLEGELKIRRSTDPDRPNVIGLDLYKNLL